MSLDDFKTLLHDITLVVNFEYQCSTIINHSFTSSALVAMIRILPLRWVFLSHWFHLVFCQYFKCLLGQLLVWHYLIISLYFICDYPHSSITCLLVCLLAWIAENNSLISCFPAFKKIRQNAFCYIILANISIVCLCHGMFLSPFSTHLCPLLLITGWLLC